MEVEEKQCQFESHLNRWDKEAVKCEGALHWRERENGREWSRYLINSPPG